MFRLSLGDGTGRSLEVAAGADRADLSGSGSRAASVPAGDGAAGATDAELICLERVRDGRAPYEITPIRVFAGLSLTKALPDETTILNCRHLPEEYELAPEILSRVNAFLTRKGLMLKRGSKGDATIIAAPSSTKNADGDRDPEMHRTTKGNQWHFGIKAHIRKEADSRLVHTVATTPANEADVELVHERLRGKEQVAHADLGYTGADKRVQRKKLEWRIAAKRGRIKSMADGREKRKLEAIEKRKASVRAKVEHPFRVIKRQFGFTKVRYRGLKKNAAQVQTLFALSNLWMARRKLMASAA